MSWIWRARWRRGPLFASAGVAVSLALVAVTLRNALHIAPPDPSASQTPPTMAPLAAARSGPTDDEISRAVGLAPFRPDRQPPAQRFEDPATAVAAPAVPAPQTASPADLRARLRVAGTVVTQEGGFAMCEWMAEPARIVHVGESIGGLTLRTVYPGRAVFRDASGATMEVRVPRPGQ